MPPLKTNALYYGDNLQILRDYIPDESIDLIYLNPPFNSNRSYNILFKETTADASQAQIEAFEDTWHWGKVAQETFEDIALHGGDDTARLLKAMVDALGHNDVTAYLTMMAVRLVELRRVLKPMGSIYLHCDPTAGPYLRVVMDSIFGPRNFRNEIVWKRTSAHNSGNKFGPIHDTILFYARTNQATWNVQRRPLDESYEISHYTHIENGRRYKRQDVTGAGIRHGETGQPWRGINPTLKGRHWMRPPAELDKWDAEGRIYFPPKPGAWPYLKLFLDESTGMPVQDVWDDIDPVNPVARERLGYPTQKPLALLERIILASSNPGAVVLDPFCGCGTAIHAAQKLDRLWVGIDITHLAVGLVRRRMEDAFSGLKIEVVGEPVDLSGARELADNDKYQFQWWVVDKIGAQPVGDKRKGMDRGIDGIIPFIEGRTDRKRVIVSVKGGGVGSKDIRDLKGVLDREGEPIGVLVTLRPPTREMTLEAVSAGHYESEFWKRKYPRIQILTVEDILNGKAVEMPSRDAVFAQAPRERQQEGEQPSLLE